MQKRAIIMLLVALIMGGIAVSLVNTAIEQKTEQEVGVAALSVTPVVVASANLEIGTRLNEVMLKVVDWPKEAAPEGTYATIEEALGKEPPVVIKEMRKGEALLPYKLSGQGARGGLTPRISNEMRAMTISVNEVRGVAGFVLPGDRVDVLYTKSADRKYVTKSLLQNMLVLGVDQQTSEKEDKPQIVNAVTLLVTPQEGKMLTLAQKAGELTLLLRNEADVSVSSDGSLSTSDIDRIGKKAALGSSKGSGNYTNIQVIRGLNTRNYTVKLAPTATTPTSENPGTVTQERGK
ncbi:pilus assembly protein CpaB [Mariprofundus ferrinatatus]|uniref:Pilus assembly protein CpaB n=1 Tax=Mariprofundus ferrinatatus TaxID=1921087 RepID=A0A2K8L3C2_9PROT|nr:Flp pilus assembly protein CpaB [Mariprofundus ferrinatatus]ATX81777.1 pilus assembly protein CpaB [Mariprofundus ferrinatatus]